MHFFLQFEIKPYYCLLPGKKNRITASLQEYRSPGQALSRYSLLASRAGPENAPAGKPSRSHRLPSHPAVTPAAGLGQAASQKPREGSAFYGTRKRHIWREGSAMYGQGSACVEPSASRFRSALALRPGSDDRVGSFKCEGEGSRDAAARPEARSRKVGLT